jgi:hypothetical protein
MTIEDFNVAGSAYTRRIFIVGGLAVVVMFACFAVVVPFRDALRTQYEEWFGKVAAEALMGLTPLPGLLVLIGGLSVVEYRARRNSRLRCPHCRRMLTGMRPLVVATRNCGHCGRRVLAEPEGWA